MLKRIVMWRLHDFAQDKSKRDNAQLLKDLLEQLPKKIPVIEHFKVAINVADDSAAADLVLISFFANREALNDFLDHSEYVEVLEFVKNISSDHWYVEYQD